MCCQFNETLTGSPTSEFSHWSHNQDVGKHRTSENYAGVSDQIYQY